MNNKILTPSNRSQTKIAIHRPISNIDSGKEIGNGSMLIQRKKTIEDLLGKKSLNISVNSSDNSS